jgi:hypothetical protein
VDADPLPKLVRGQRRFRELRETPSSMAASRVFGGQKAKPISSIRAGSSGSIAVTANPLGFPWDQCGALVQRLRGFRIRYQSAGLVIANNRDLNVLA